MEIITPAKCVARRPIRWLADAAKERDGALRLAVDEGAPFQQLSLTAAHGHQRAHHAQRVLLELRRIGDVRGGPHTGNESQFLETISGPPQWSEFFRSICCGGLAGFLAGIVFFGIGSRPAVRAVALLNPEAKGTLTGAGKIVGAITLNGTVALVVLVGRFGGVIAGGIWVLVRERLPEHLSLRTALSGVIATLVGAS